MLVINGQFPGPLIRVNLGDRLLINVTNQLSQPTTLHWHGLYQNGTNWMDGVSGITQCPIPPGRNFLYNYTVENQFGTFWYHSHTSTQYMDGLVGPFIVHAPEEAIYQQMYDTDQVVLIQDWYHNISAELLPGYLAPGNENLEPVPDNGLIQGTALYVPLISFLLGQPVMRNCANRMQVSTAPRIQSTVVMIAMIIRLVHSSS